MFINFFRFVLFLFLSFSGYVSAAIGYDWQRNGTYSYSTPEQAANGSIPSQRPSSYKLESCTENSYPITESGTDWGSCLFRNHPSTWVTDSQGVFWKLFPDQCVALSHQPDPITGNVGSTNMQDCSCDEGYVSSGGVPGEEEYDCVLAELPPEICFTTIESMQDQCVYIGEDDPNDDVPEGCVVDADTGVQICLSDQDGCYEANGNTVCPTPGMICGVKNGAFSCVSPEEEGCGYFNGERVCFDPDGNKVDKTSPDHPDNGGNLDGDDGNDPTDPRPPDEGGDPDNQPGKPSEPTTDDNRASEKTAQDQLRVQKQIKQSIDSLPGKIRDQLTEPATSVTGGQIAANMEAAASPASDAADGVISDIQTNPMSGSDANSTIDSFGNDVLGLVPSGSCAGLNFSVGLMKVDITCEKASKIRDILSFILYAFTVITLFHVVVKPSGVKR